MKSIHVYIFETVQQMHVRIPRNNFKGDKRTGERLMNDKQKNITVRVVREWKGEVNV